MIFKANEITRSLDIYTEKGSHGKVEHVGSVHLSATHLVVEPSVKDGFSYYPECVRLNDGSVMVSFVPVKTIVKQEEVEQ
jgi:hypothetical protein